LPGQITGIVERGLVAVDRSAGAGDLERRWSGEAPTPSVFHVGGRALHRNPEGHPESMAAILITSAVSRGMRLASHLCSVPLQPQRLRQKNAEIA